ncbi:AraC family transcriptional regulator ligand-binding domain-containing protein [Halopseudomonas pachastrellae]|nr:AraC family transcriptional regulator ligand-binding domain-containing protein [Halopseudomonas pachastrellae]
MLENSSSDSFAHVRESAFWVTTIEQALRQYELSLVSSSQLAHLLDSQSSDPNFIDQRLCSHAWDEAVRISEDPLFGLRIHRVFAPTAYAALALAAAASPAWKMPSPCWNAFSVFSVLN